MKENVEVMSDAIASGMRIAELENLERKLAIKNRNKARDVVKNGTADVLDGLRMGGYFDNPPKEPLELFRALDWGGRFMGGEDVNVPRNVMIPRNVMEKLGKTITRLVNSAVEEAALKLVQKETIDIVELPLTKTDDI